MFDQKSTINSMLWLTDLHYDKKNKEEKEELFDYIQDHLSDVLCLSGDIGEKETTMVCLEELSKKFNKKIAFVLGNHDFYHNFIAERQFFLSKVSHPLYYLSQMSGMNLSREVALIGLDNWYNLNDNNFSEVEFLIQDFKSIHDFQTLSVACLVNLFDSYAKNHCMVLKQKLQFAINSGIKKIYLALHVPPYHSCHYYDHNTLMQNQYRYYWSNSLLGLLINDFMKNYPDRYLTILSGHTHIRSKYRPISNVESIIGSPSDKKPNAMRFDF